MSQLSNSKYPHANPGSTADTSSSNALTRAVQRRTTGVNRSIDSTGASTNTRATLLGEKPNPSILNESGRTTGDSSSRTYFQRRLLGFKFN